MTAHCCCGDELLHSPADLKGRDCPMPAQTQKMQLQTGCLLHCSPALCSEFDPKDCNMRVKVGWFPARNQKQTGCTRLHSSALDLPASFSTRS
jgi:hypothetical protein